MSGAALNVLLLAAANATSGGGEKHVADLLELLPGRGVEVALAAPAGGDLGALAERLGAPAFDVPIASGLAPRALTAIRRAIEETGADVVHAHGSRAAAFARLADPRARERVVYTVHGIHFDKAGSRARRAVFGAVERSLRPKTARFITVCRSDVDKGALLGVLDPARTSVVYNGIALPVDSPPRGAFRAELGLAEATPLVISIGRFHEQKDQATLVRAWAAVSAATPDATLVLIGEGELEGRLREIAVAAGVSERVRFVRPRADLGPVYADADLFALSSAWEGLPYVVIEAMAHGLAVAATAVDGVPEAVVDGETGLLVAAGDAAALGGALVRLLGDAAERRRFGQAGAALVAELFSVERMVDDTIAVYDGLLGEAEGSAQ